MAAILNREFLTLFLTFLVVASLVAWVVANPPANEDFASLSVLGSRMSASFYFPSNSSPPIVTLNKQIQWYVQVYNHQKSIQLYAIYVLLANLTTTNPNATSNTPSGGVLLAQYYRAMQNNETWTLPMSWLIMNETSVPGKTTIEQVVINNLLVNDTDLSAVNGQNFRLVIELWSYDLEVHNYVFSFFSRGVLDSVFDQIWFNTG